MNARSHVQPTLDAEAFHCPYPTCGVFARQNWSILAMHLGPGWAPIGTLKGALCSHCRKVSVWSDGILVFPVNGTAPAPNSDLPEDIRADFVEAGDLLSRSPRAAAALLRLAVQKLCKFLGQGGENINNDIAALTRQGLLPSVQQALDSVRVIGNNAVHPGQIDLNDQPETASALFRLVNLIADQMITYPKEAQEVFSSLPLSNRDAITRRDQPK